MPLTEWLLSLINALLAGVAVAAAVFVTRVVTYLRRHRPIANRRFVRHYRAEHPTTSRATMMPSRSSLPLVARYPDPAGAIAPSTAAPAGSTSTERRTA